MTRFLLPVLLTLACSAPALAQAASPVPGDRVRVASPDATGRFVVDDIDVRILTLRDAEGVLVRVPLSSLERLSVSLGRRSRGAGALRGAGIGFASGAVTGIAMGFISGDDEHSDIPLSAEEKAVLLGILLGATGGVAGGLLGLAAPGERWEAVPLTHLRGAISRDGGVMVGYTIRF